MSDLLFKRRARVTFAMPVKQDFKSISADVLEVEGLHIQFTVNKSLGKEPNTASVVVRNLTRDHRARMQQAGGKFMLQGGYDATIAQLFIGDVRSVDNKRDGADWVTTIESGDGERAFNFGRVNESFKGGALGSDVLNKIVGAMGVNLGNMVTAEKILGGRVYSQGYSAYGPAARELDRLLEPVGLSWSIQDGELQILGDKESATLLIPDISAGSGLVGSPEFGVAEKNKGAVIKVKCLLNPRMRPGGKFRLRSARYDGDVRIIKLTHNGDNESGDWYTSVEGEPA